MLDQSPSNEIDQWLHEGDKFCSLLQERMHSTKIPLGTMVDSLRGAILFALIRGLRPKIVVETGVASGGSTFLILKALDLNNQGELYSIDVPDVAHGLPPAGKEVGWLVPRDLKKRWELIIGYSENELPRLLKKLEFIDVFLHDSGHTYECMTFEFTTVWPYLRDTGSVVSDDIKLSKAFRDFAKRVKSKKLVEFNGFGAIFK